MGPDSARFPQHARRSDERPLKRGCLRSSLEVVFFNEQHQWRPVLLCNEVGVWTGAYIDYYTRETVPFFLCYDFLICNTKRHYSVFEWHPQAFYVPWGTDTDLYKPDLPSRCLERSANILSFLRHESGTQGHGFRLKGLRAVERQGASGDSFAS